MVTDAQKGADAEIKASQRASLEGIKERQKADKETDKLRTKGVKDALKAFDEELKAFVKAENSKEKAADKAANYRAMVQRNSAALAGRIAEQEVRDAESAEKKKQAARERFGRGIGGSLSSLGGTAMRLGGAAMALGGGFAISDIVQKKFEAEKNAAMFVNQVTTGGKAPEGANVAAVMKQAKATALKTGLETNDVVSGALAYSQKAKGGDFNGAMDNMEFFAKMAKVTGADIKDVAGAAGTLQSQNPELGKDPAAMRQMLLDVYAQGKQGSMSMVDVSKQIGVLASTRNAYQGSTADNQRKLLGLGQLAAPEGTVEEAGTFIKDLTLEAGKHSKDLKKMGVKYNDRGQMESPEQMIDAVFKGTKGDQTKIEKLFGARGSALFRSLGQSYNGAGGGEAGITAVNKAMANVTGATMTNKDLDAQLEQSLSTPGEKFHKAVEQVSQIIEEKLTPYLEKFADKLPELIPEIEKAVDAVAGFAEWFLDNPIKGIGAVILASVVKDMAGAAIGKAIASAISAAGSAAGPIAIAAGAVAITVLGMEAIDQHLQARHDAIQDESKDVNDAIGLIGDAKGGKPIDKVKATDLIANLQRDKKKATDDISEQTGIKGIASSLGMKDVAATAQGNIAADTKRIDTLNEQIKALTAAIASANSGTKPHPLAPNQTGPLSGHPRGGPA